jgi:tRNA nucleotidyltransferase (CCA-adding enzyme)
MRVILTHEQADFDALASLLGAYLVDETSVPVLPRKMNRNVRAFVTLYGAELPFVDPRDLPNEPLEQVTLVDTQSPVTLKGMNDATRFQVVDHHPLRSDLGPDWQVICEEIGATTTIFVEALQEKGSALSAVQATLLLLGIYEDTGSLTYTRTTARDIRAAAHLVEQGALLGVASGFLNHPLSLQQQALYDHLRASAQTLNIHGHTVIVAAGDAQKLDEELSTIAHKLRDLLDPDCLLLLIITRSGVQLIARSTSDNIDVAQIAGEFGGGGHARAAAALIKDRSLEAVQQELIANLPRYVRPAVTVAQIMSRGAQVLSPETPVEEAAQRMRRYGYEGYPVVKDGKVVGLLTRRAVDRAISHNLKLTAASLMEAGEVVVYPEDSLEKLQRLMTDTGWGQIPVITPHAAEVIGIVTRTDLLKTLQQRVKLPGRQKLVERLETALPAARLALLQAVAEQAHRQHAALYIVGGFVRDLMLDRPSLDFDLVVEGDAILLARSMAEKYGGKVTSHTRFGTAKWFVAEVRASLTGSLERQTHREEAVLHSGALDGQAFTPADLPDTLDFITARTEFYPHPTALPMVERGSIKLDLHRRDFTINTLALRLDGSHYGELHDYWGGLADLHQGIVRCLHSLSFVDDPTRMLRAVRFEQRFGFRIEVRTLQLIHEARTLLDRTSGDRIRHELDHILEEAQTSSMLARLDELKLLQSIHPDLHWDTWLQEKTRLVKNLDLENEWQHWADPELAENRLNQESLPQLRRQLFYILWLIRLPQKTVEEAAARLKFSRNTANSILSAWKLRRELPELVKLRPSQVVGRLEEVSDLAMYAVYQAVDDSSERELLERYSREWRKQLPITTGHDLLARGLSSGPEFRTILTMLRDAWLDGKISSVEEEKGFLEEILSRGK